MLTDATYVVRFRNFDIHEQKDATMVRTEEIFGSGHILRNCLFNSTIKQRAYSRKDLQHMYIVLKHFCRTLGQTGIKSFACFVWLHE
jgi:hypothetical protein